MLKIKPASTNIRFLAPCTRQERQATILLSSLQRISDRH
jgi:hypothetical protein